MLVAIEDVAVAVAHGLGADSGGVGAGAWLGEGEGGHPVAFGQLGEIAGLLLGRAGQHDGDGPQALDADDERRRGVYLSQLLHDQAEGQHIRASPAVLLGEGQGQQLLPGQSLLDVPGVLARLVHLGGAGGDDLLGQVTHHVPEHALLLG